MKKYIVLVTVLSTLIISGCSRHAKVIVDPHGVDMSNYQADLSDCRQLSEQVESKVGKGLLGGAVVGAVAGEIVGGGNRTNIGSKLGALSGAIKGGRATKIERARVVKNCLRHRGYRVLN